MSLNRFALFHEQNTVPEESRNKYVDKNTPKIYNIQDRDAPSRDMLPKGIIVRKVRASQGRITDNVRRG